MHYNRQAMLRQAIIACAILFFAAMLSAAVIGPGVAAGCPERPACRGCGCKGGPGYRGPNGACVGFRELYEVCGDPPTTYCVFENAPGTGANRSCAGPPRQNPVAKKKSSKSGN